MNWPRAGTMPALIRPREQIDGAGNKGNGMNRTFKLKSTKYAQI